MNKKSLMIVCLLLFIFVFNLEAITLQTAKEKVQELRKSNKTLAWEWTEVLKTYQLKHIRPEDLINATRLYIIDATVYKDTVTVKIRNTNVSTFEELLKKMDVEKKNILFKVYTIVALRESAKKEEQVEIEDKGLKQVLGELKNLWNFQSYKIDDPFFITVKEESGSNFFGLASESFSGLGLRIQHVNLSSDKPGKRIITIEQIQLLSSNMGNEQLFIDSNHTTVKEDGYLVVGVSGLNWKGRVLILVISAEIKD